MLAGPIDIESLCRHARRRGADLVLRLEVDTLRCQGAMIDARVDIEFGEPRVNMIGPRLTPMAQQLGAIPVAHLGTKLGGFVIADLNLAHRQHDMRVRPRQPVRAHIPMDIEIGDHPALDELGLHEVAGQFDALLPGHLARDRELDFAGELGILANLHRLDIIPELFSISPLFRRAFGEQHFAVNDARLVREVVGTAEPLIVEPIGGAIGRGRDRAAAGGARDDFCGKMVDRHSGVPFTANQARRHDV